MERFVSWHGRGASIGTTEAIFRVVPQRAIGLVVDVSPASASYHSEDRNGWQCRRQATIGLVRPTSAAGSTTRSARRTCRCRHDPQKPRSMRQTPSARSWCPPHSVTHQSGSGCAVSMLGPFFGSLRRPSGQLTLRISRGASARRRLHALVSCFVRHQDSIGRNRPPGLISPREPESLASTRNRDSSRGSIGLLRCGREIARE